MNTFTTNELPPSLNNLPIGNILSKRQTQVLQYIARGYTAKRIALILGISYRTVETYIEILKDKLHCQSKWELIQIGIKMGLLNL